MKDILPASQEVRGRFSAARLNTNGGRLELHHLALTFLDDPTYGANLAAARVTREQIINAGRIQIDRDSQPDGVYIPPASIKTLVHSASRLAAARKAVSIETEDIFNTMYSINGGGLEALLLLSEDPRGLSETILTGRIEPDREYHEQRRAEVKVLLERNAQHIVSSEEIAA